MTVFQRHRPKPCGQGIGDRGEHAYGSVSLDRARHLPRHDKVANDGRKVVMSEKCPLPQSEHRLIERSSSHTRVQRPFVALLMGIKSWFCPEYGA